MAQIGTKGANLDLLVRQGATQGPYYTTIRKQDGTPLNITSATFGAKIRKTPTDAAESVTFTFSITDGANGKFTWSIPAADTAGLTASPIDENQPESQYVWDMEVTMSDSTVIPLFYGIVKVFREITKT